MDNQPISVKTPALLSSWRAACAAFTLAAKQPGAENFDTPDCVALQSACATLSDELRWAVPTMRKSESADQEATIPRRVVAKVMGFLSAGR